MSSFARAAAAVAAEDEDDADNEDSCEDREWSSAGVENDDAADEDAGVDVHAVSRTANMHARMAAVNRFTVVFNKRCSNAVTLDRLVMPLWVVPLPSPWAVSSCHTGSSHLCPPVPKAKDFPLSCSVALKILRVRPG